MKRKTPGIIFGGEKKLDALPWAITGGPATQKKKKKSKGMMKQAKEITN